MVNATFQIIQPNERIDKCHALGRNCVAWYDFEGRTPMDKTGITGCLGSSNQRSGKDRFGHYLYDAPSGTTYPTSRFKLQNNLYRAGSIYGFVRRTGTCGTYSALYRTATENVLSFQQRSSDGSITLFLSGTGFSLTSVTGDYGSFNKLFPDTSQHYHLLITWDRDATDGKRIKVFVDDELRLYSNATWTVGKYHEQIFFLGNASYRFLGRIYRAAYFNKALNTDEYRLLRYNPRDIVTSNSRFLYGAGLSPEDKLYPATFVSEASVGADGAKEALGPATHTAMASMSASGAKGATSPLNIVGTATVGSCGQKTAFGPAHLVVGATFSAGGTKTILGVDKEGPCVITAQAGHGLGGIKGATGPAVIGVDALAVADGTKGAVGPFEVSALSAFLAHRWQDGVPITTAEVARVVTASSRAKIVIAKDRIREVRYAVS